MARIYCENKGAALLEMIAPKKVVLASLNDSHMNREAIFKVISVDVTAFQE